MNEKIEELLRKGQYRIEDGGDGIFVCLDYIPNNTEQKELYATASRFYEDVSWCPEPDSHNGASAVLNCFYPIEK